MWIASSQVFEKAMNTGTYSGEALRMAKQLIMNSADDVEARRRAGERERRDIVVRFAAETTELRLAAFGDRKSKSKIQNLLHLMASLSNYDVWYRG
jgi:peroxisomal 3,2-trans-enoyl-CoA isomerase